jgi:hypothetical protein
LRTTSRSLAACAAAVLLSSILSGRVAAQQRQMTATDSLRMRVDSLISRIDSLRAALARVSVQPAPAQPAQDTMDPLARIRAAAAAAAAAAGGGAVDTTTAQATPAATEFVGRQRNLSMLNPEISVTGDIFGFSRSTDANGDNFIPREFELSFVSNLDPYSRAKVFISHHSPGGEIEPFPEQGAAPEEAGVDVEEGYVEWVSLAGGLGVTLGKFRQRFGKLNRWHSHALPGQQLPLPYLAFLGGEGLAQPGVSVHWLVPIHSGGTYEVWGEATRSDNPALFGSSNGLSVLGHVNGFWELSPAVYVELGLSGTSGARGIQTAPVGATAAGDRLFGADLTFDWRPPSRGTYQQFTIHSGAMVNQRTYTGAADVSAWGAFADAEYKFSTRWIAGARYEYTENPDAPDQHAWLAGPTLTWWQSEFVRLRSEYQLYRGPADRFGQLVFQATFAMGPHKHENY